MPDHTPAPTIEFPCQYPIKVMGEAVDDFRVDVVEIFRRHAPEVSDDQVTVRESAKGNYLSITVVIQATGEAQLTALFADLKAVDSVKLVL
jgi:putative lipoic acid-binding regulatory protein